MIGYGLIKERTHCAVPYGIKSSLGNEFTHVNTHMCVLSVESWDVVHLDILVFVVG
jgi:hypothetical protein